MASEQKLGGVREVRYSNPDAELPTYYANNVEFLVSTWDLRLRFGQIKAVTDKDLMVHNIATVFMSVEHAKVFLAKMAESLAKWDEINAKGTTTS